MQVVSARHRAQPITILMADDDADDRLMTTEALTGARISPTTCASSWTARS